MHSFRWDTGLTTIALQWAPSPPWYQYKMRLHHVGNFSLKQLMTTLLHGTHFITVCMSSESANV